MLCCCRELDDWTTTFDTSNKTHEDLLAQVRQGVLRIAGKGILDAMPERHATLAVFVLSNFFVFQSYWKFLEARTCASFLRSVVNMARFMSRRSQRRK